QDRAVMDSETGGAVRDQLGANAGKRQRKTRATEPSLLAGLLFDSRGGRLTPSHAIKRGRRYRYYISAVPTAEAARDHVQNWRLAAREIEDAVITILVEALHNPTTVLDLVGTAGISSDHIRRLFSRARRLATTLSGAPGQRTAIVRELVEKVIIDVDGLAVRVRNAAVLGGTVASPAPDSASNALFELKAAVAFRRRGVATKLVLPGRGEPHHCVKCDPALIKAIARGRQWFEELATGHARSLHELATREGITRCYIRRLV